MNIEGRICRLRALEPSDLDVMYGWENDTDVWRVSGTLAPFSRHVLSRLTDEFMAEVTAKAEYIKNALTGAEGIKSVSGLGLMMGIETEKKAADVVAAAMEKGVLLLTAKTKVRLLPPLNISYEELEKAVNIIKEVCKNETFA